MKKNTCFKKTKVERICDRLLSSEEHASDASIPDVAEHAVTLIRQMATTMAAMQSALTLAIERADRSDNFVERVARLTIWGYDQDDGVPYEECEEPSDGYEDSHLTLMPLIEAARAMLD